MLYDVVRDLLQIFVLGGILGWTLYLVVCWQDKPRIRRILQLVLTLVGWGALILAYSHI